MRFLVRTGVKLVVVLVGLWAMHNEEAIRGNESGHRQHDEHEAAADGSSSSSEASTPA